MSLLANLRAPEVQAPSPLLIAFDQVGDRDRTHSTLENASKLSDIPEWIQVEGLLLFIPLEGEGDGSY